MEQMDALYELLEESAELYESLLITEREKYDAAIKNDIIKLDEVTSKEQVFYLKIKGLEQRRNKLVQDMNLEDKKFKEIIEIADKVQRPKLNVVYERLYKALIDVKQINKQCKIVIDVRLHRIDAVMSGLGRNENIYKPNDNQNHSNKSIMISKKI